MSIDRNTTLCLACSSSLPPLTSSSAGDLFTTNCCNRPICPKCLASNPRLARYDPCLSCLAGVRVVQASSSHKGDRFSRYGASSADMNVSGAIRDQDIFVLGDDEDDAVELQEYPPLPAYSLDSNSDDHIVDQPESSKIDSEDANSGMVTGDSEKPAVPSKYLIQRGDTLLGIAFRFKVDASELCRLNDLPRSTLNTTPHLLHTRTYLTLPRSSVSISPVCPSPSRAAERAAKRLQTVTKEVDWRIAKAYVSLAETDDDNAALKENKKPVAGGGGGDLEAVAVDRYLDDAEWEELERAEGRGVSIKPFPFGGFGDRGKETSSSSGLFNWPWSNS